MGFYSDKRNHQTAWLGPLVGAVYALTILLTLELCVALYQFAEFTTFNFVAAVAGIASFIVFSDARRYTIDNRAITLHDFPAIVRLWSGIFFVVVLALYLTKSAAEFSRVVMMLWLLCTPFTLTLTSLLCRWLVLRMNTAKGQRRTAVFVGFSEDAQRLSESFQTSPIFGITPLGYFDNRQTSDRMGLELPRLGRLIDAIEWFENNKVDMVFVGLLQARSSDIAPVVDALHDSVASVYFVPDSTLFGLGHIQYAELASTPVLVAYETPFLGVTRFLKRFVDIVLSALILLLLSPLMLAIAAGVKLSSPGPVLFRQMRYGVGGQQIMVSKFRSMRQQPPSIDGEVVQATVDDPRVTWFGRLIRRTSLDELPQFFNVLQGSMSIVGPRPHAVEHNELYRKQVKGYMLRHMVKPGITGWAQINGLRGQTDTLEKMQRRIEFDLYYIRHWSLALDFRIILRTVLIVLKDRHAY
ncbi:putative colanic acid biosynthesis UDP-glucose lipid carrier transferase [Herbaspirillum sp. Sphag1AN]|uniref:undecaprenyl-phosphate glucose phosphotransferase n=1 Tax=unclassified Herbaspirillum TaxID=2624150 RepID=UPI00182CF1B4|nr:putative colanic acid biosynthesis UDP-glucose lipid carrier transferase [Herbaspirillum sp. Sphag1AN]MBB3244726.1 putative colanic acid biosynthesis UDP-glucose lipid carrier transferase [Herbaspirillum sp. Sphag64]